MDNQEIHNHDLKDIQKNMFNTALIERQLKEHQDFRAYKESLWGAINEYVVLCGGDPLKHIGVAKMKKVDEIENLVFQKK